MTVLEEFRSYLSKCLDLRRTQLATLDLTPKEKWRLKGMVEAYEDAVSTGEFMEALNDNV